MEILMNVLPLLLMVGVMYFLLIRPQKKQMEEKKAMISSLQPGQSVITIGGLNGIIDEVLEDQGKVVIDCEGVYLTFELPSIAKVNPLEPAVTDTVQVDDLSPKEASEEEIVVEEAHPVEEPHLVEEPLVSDKE